MHFNIKSIQILEELLHPIHCDLVVSPSLVQKNQKFGTILPLQLINNVLVEVVLDRLRVLPVQDALCLLKLEGT